MLRSLIALVLLCSGLASAQELKSPDVILGRNSVARMMPQEFVCAGTDLQAGWSPSGDWLLVLKSQAVARESGDSIDLFPQFRRNSEVGPAQLVAYGAKGRKLQVLFELDGLRASFEDLIWFPKSNNFLAVLTESVKRPSGEVVGGRGLYIASPSTGKVKSIGVFASEDSARIEMSPVSSLCAIVSMRRADSDLPEHDPSLRSVRFVGMDGVVSPPVELPPKSSFLWIPGSGKPAAVVSKRDASGRKNTLTWFSVDVQGRKVSPMIAPEAVLDKPGDETGEGDDEKLHNQFAFGNFTLRAKGLVLFSDRLDVRSGDYTAKAGTVWLGFKDGKAEDAGVVSTDAKDVSLASTGERLCFVSQGSVYVRTIAKVSREEYNRQLLAAQKQQAINYAKQAALAMIMYSADNDDNFISKADNWRDKVFPYTKDRDILSRFNLEFAGGNATSIEKPAETVLGYVNAPGGRAVAYTDGHVKWIPNP